MSFDCCCLAFIFMRLIFTSIGCVSVGLSINTFYPLCTNNTDIKRFFFLFNISKMVQQIKPEQHASLFVWVILKMVSDTIWIGHILSVWALMGKPEALELHCKELPTKLESMGDILKSFQNWRTPDPGECPALTETRSFFKPGQRNIVENISLILSNPIQNILFIFHISYCLLPWHKGCILVHLPCWDWVGGYLSSKASKYIIEMYSIYFYDYSLKKDTH